MNPDYYKVLDVDPGASLEEIHRAWRRLARAHHPDRSPPPGPAPEVSMALLNEAWATLGDRSLREAYDQGRRAPEPAAVQDAVLAAARAVLSGRVRADAGTEVGRPSCEKGDLWIENPPARVSVRFVRLLGTAELEAWLQSAAIAFGRDRVSPAVLIACRVLVPDEAHLRLQSIRVPAVAIDLIRSKAFGAFPCARSEELFSPFLR